MADEDDAGKDDDEISGKDDEDDEFLGEGGYQDSVKPVKGTIEPDEYQIWRGRDFGGEYGEADMFYFPVGEEEYPPTFAPVEYASSESISSASVVSEIEITEEEKLRKLERERLIDLIRQKMVDRVSLRRRNVFLHKKLVEHFKKRRMENVLKEDPKGAELESKYLKRLFVFQEFKESQENEIVGLTENMLSYKAETDQVENELNDTLNAFIQRQKELSLNLISAKTGKKLNEKFVDRLLRRQVMKCEEKGKLKLKYVKLKNLIEEKESQLKAMENFGEGLHIMDYEQMKIDNQNYADKIEEKEEELTKLRVKTHGTIQNLAQVREKAYAIEGDIELMETKFFEVETEFNNTRELVGRAKEKRDSLREEYARLKIASGLLTNDNLLKDFERSIIEKERVEDILIEMKALIKEKTKKQSELAILARASKMLYNQSRPRMPANRSRIIVV